MRCHGLTPAELRVLQLAANGWPNKRIAAELGVCTPTVKNQMASVCQSLRVENRTAAVVVGLQLRLVDYRLVNVARTI